MQPTHINIQLYKTAKDNTGEAITAQQAIEKISSGSLNAIVANIRRNLHTVAELKAKLEKEKNEEKQAELQQRIKEYQWTADELKKSLPAVTWSGTFTKRSKEGLQQYSGLICIDIDKQPAIDELKKKLKADPYTWLIFTSPSGNGLKVIVQVAAGPEYHLQSFVALEIYYKKIYDIVIDPSGKDICRLCFLTTDTDFQCNYNSTVFTATAVPEAVEKTIQKTVTTKKEEKQLQSATTATDVWKITADYMSYAEGQRNQFIYKYACNCNRKGVEMTEAENYAQGQATDLKPKEVTDSIRSAYTHNAAEWAQYAKKKKPESNGHNAATTKDIRNSGPGMAGHRDNRPDFKSNHINGKEHPPFWFETENKKATDKEGNPLRQFNIHYTGLIEFLASCGYHRLPMPNKTFEFIHYQDNVCDTVPIQYMKDHVMDWCIAKQQQANTDSDKTGWVTIAGVREMLIRGAERYFNVNKLSILPYKKIDFIKDTRDCAHFFFNNCYVKVTKDGIETRPITELQKTLWRADIIDRDFKLEKIFYPETDKGFDLENFNCEFAKYMALVSSNPKHYGEINKETVIERFYSHCSAVGFMLHGWKNKIGKAIVAVDHKIPEDKSEQNGGTGKSIYGESFKYLKSTCIIDGKDFKEDYPFRFERIGVDTKVVVMQDCRYNLDFASFFVPITGDFTYNKRHTGYITIPYEDSGKWWFDTNFTFKGDGSSFRRRQHIIEFDDRFDEHHTPYEEFGHLLFQDWDDAEWNRFYNHYFQCVQTFLATGLIDYPQSNYDNRRLMTETPIEFIDFFDASEETNGQLIYKIPRNKWLVKKELMKLWNEEAKAMNMHQVTPHLFSKWYKKYCTTKGLIPMKDKTNGVEYYLLATAEYNGSKKFNGKIDLFNQTTI